MCLLIRYLVAATLMSIFCPTPAQSGWLAYHKPAFEGEVFDAETNTPIEGALVIVFYNKTYLNPAGSITVPFDARETLTEKDGRFHFSSYTTLINPLCVYGECYFSVAKPGYASLQEVRAEDNFSHQKAGNKEYLSSDPTTKLTHKMKIIAARVLLPSVPDLTRGYERIGVPLHYDGGKPNWGRFPLTKKYYFEEQKEIELIARRQNYHKEVEADLIEIPKMVASFNQTYEYYIRSKKDKKTLEGLKRMQYVILLRYKDFKQKEQYVAEREKRPERILNLNMIATVQ